jgi:hypothetical protein
MFICDEHENAIIEIFLFAKVNVKMTMIMLTHENVISNLDKMILFQLVLIELFLSNKNIFRTKEEKKRKEENVKEYFFILFFLK